MEENEQENNEDMVEEDGIFSYDLKIPKDRIAVLIGKNGEIKKELESITKVKIEVDSKEGDVNISGTDPIRLYTIRDLVRAIGRGFNPDIAKLLLKQDYSLEIISLNDYSKEKNHQQRLKGRVIGQDGKSRKTIEDLTNCNINVYGKTIAIIGRVENIDNCRRAINQLLMGSMHANVFKWLEKQKRLHKDERYENI
ncbi:MAG: KH domain-containing protein [Candidatus Woesearchaeota archaeon]